jgi:hypothetical protein
MFDTSKAFFAAGIGKVCRAERNKSAGIHDMATMGVWIVRNIVMSSAHVLGS